MKRRATPSQSVRGRPRLRLIVAIAVVAAVLPLEASLAFERKGTPSVPDKPLVECLRKGHEALDKENLDEAVKAFAVCVKQHPRSGLAHYWLGMAHFYSKNQDQAIKDLTEAARLDPEEARPLHMLGRVYSHDKHKLSLAEELLRRALTRDPHSNDCRLDLARVYNRQGEIKKAFEQFALIFRSEKKFAFYHTELGRLMTALGQMEEAKEQFLRALVLSPGYERAEKLLRDLEKKSTVPGHGPTESTSREKKKGPSSGGR